MKAAFLVVNAGSSSIKFALYAAPGRPQRSTLLCEGEVSGLAHGARLLATDGAAVVLTDQRLAGGASHEEAVDMLLGWIASEFAGHSLLAAGHRVVHSGMYYTAPAQVDALLLEALRALVPLAPLHQPHNIAAIEALQRRHPGLLQVACFDTAFHHGQAELVTRYALPRRLHDEGLRRYGFHGLSYEYIASALPETLGAELAAGRIVVAHLGAGASMCGLIEGKSVASSMGFTALDGLPMATRCGSLDPGLLLYLMQEKCMSAENISHMLYNESGLLGVSGVSEDMRTLLASADPRAEEAIALFVYRIGRELGSLAAALGGLDALVFTGGIGEHAAEIRRRVCEQASWLGVECDEAANRRGGPLLSPETARVRAWALATDEDLMIARHTEALWSKLRG